MQLTTRRLEDLVVVELAGRLDSHSAGAVGDRLDAIGASGEKRVLLSLAGLDYISSAGLRAILRLSRLLKSHGGELRVSEPGGMVATVLETVGFDSLLQIHPTEAEARTAFGL